MKNSIIYYLFGGLGIVGLIYFLIKKKAPVGFLECHAFFDTTEITASIEIETEMYNTPFTIILSPGTYHLIATYLNYIIEQDIEIILNETTRINFLFPPTEMIDDCESRIGWTATYSASPQELSSERKQGNYSIAMGKIAEGWRVWYYKDLDKTYNSVGKILKIWIYVEDVNDLGSPQGSIGVNNNRWGVNSLINGWNEVTLDSDDPAISRLHIEFYTTKDGIAIETGRFKMDAWRLVPKQ